MKKFKSLAIGSAVAVSAIANAQGMTTSDVHMIVREEVSCEWTGSTESSLVGCADVHDEFEKLLHSDRVDEIYDLYAKENIQMEMMYEGRSGGTHK